ncbi:hypothetical protein NF867_15630 [Solitalea sp. MAHUQ-68]|uniref:Uncharacterized protein n=1 Tax=Solitalea agri TaxID=2953739 RepID=A0A9X2JD96_9SPHI|nr:hypothetical protein [Solitalea agri]MCO4294292.1 hypothetical protein [Solitalea agri]
MDEYQIPFVGNKIYKARSTQKNLYRITRDNQYIGFIRWENGGWMLEENAKEELTAENVQLIGEKIDRLKKR